MSIPVLVVLATVLGTLLGFATELMRSRKKAHESPGGSLTTGFLIGAFLGTHDSGLVSLLVGGASGLAGWLLYRYLTPIGEK